jgi:hypothetical protein
VTSDANDVRIELLLRNHERIVKVANVALPDALDAALNDASLFVGNQEIPASLEHLKPVPGKRDWLELMRMRMGYTLEALAMAHYHVLRVIEIEAQIRRTLIEGLEPMPNSNLGFNSRILNAEYQAFVFALRRSLEYFAAAAAAYFKTECSRIRTVAAVVRPRQPSDLAKSVAGTIEAGLEALPDLLSTGNDQSVRDRLSHYEYVPAGTFNAAWSPDGELTRVALVEGGERLPGLEGEPRELSEVLTSQFEAAAGIVVDTYRVLGFIAATRST